VCGGPGGNDEVCVCKTPLFAGGAVVGLCGDQDGVGLWVEGGSFSLDELEAGGGVGGEAGDDRGEQGGVVCREGVGLCDCSGRGDIP